MEKLTPLLKATLYYLFFVLLFITSCQKGKNLAIDHVSNDSIVKFLEYANEESIPLGKRLEFNDRAFSILQERKNDSLTRDFITKWAVKSYNENELESFKKFTTLLQKKSLEIKDTTLIAKAYRFQVEYYKFKNQNDSAFYYILQAEKYYRGSKVGEELGKVLLDKGRIQYIEDDYFGAELSVTKAYSSFLKSENKQKMFECLSIIGTIANDLKDYDRALDFHTRAYIYAKNNNLNDSYTQYAISLNNIGNVYQNLNKNSEAIPYFINALKSHEQLEILSPELFALLLDNLAYSYLQTENFTELPSLFLKAHNIRDSLKLSQSLIFSKIHLSEYYARSGDLVNSHYYAENAYNLAKQVHSPTSVIATLKNLSIVKPANASVFGREYIRINDSLHNEERKSKDKFARIQFETDEISLQKDILEEQNRNLFSFFIATIMIILLLFVIRTQRAKNRELLLREAQQNANEEIYNLMLSQQHKMEEGRIKEKKKIAQELHDGVLGRLFGARLNLDSLNKTEGEEAELRRKNYLIELKNIEQDIREISHDLSREKSALINNFVAIFNNLLEEQSTSYSAKLDSNISDDIKWDQISNNLKINIYRITQEALQNINKYANSKNITINLLTIGESIKLSIVDDGIGFDLIKKSKGIGIQNITTRAEQCKGVVKIKSAKGQGTSITVIFPEKQHDNVELKAKSKNQKSEKKWLPLSTS